MKRQRNRKMERFTNRKENGQNTTEEPNINCNKKKSLCQCRRAAVSAQLIIEQSYKVVANEITTGNKLVSAPAFKILPVIITSSPSCRNLRVTPLPSSTVLVPFQLSSSRLPNESSVYKHRRTQHLVFRKFSPGEPRV